MAPLPVIADTYRVSFEWAAGQQSAANVMHFRTASSGATPEEVWDCIDANVTANMWASCSTGSVIQEVRVTPLDGSSATQAFGTGSGAKWQGQTSGDFVPAGAAIIKLSTAKRGRSFRGRVFLPFLAEAAFVNGLLELGPLGLAQTAWEDFANDIIADPTTPMALVVASYKLAESNQVLNLLAENVAGTQRRRQGRLRD